jgi:hypothetical protein
LATEVTILFQINQSWKHSIQQSIHTRPIQPTSHTKQHQAAVMILRRDQKTQKSVVQNVEIQFGFADSATANNCFGGYNQIHELGLFYFNTMR